jgi:HSP20 family protein
MSPAYGWDPRREMDEINSRFGQLIRTFFGDAPTLAAVSGWSPLSPPIDVEETDNAYVVDVDLPNVNPEDVDIEMRGEELRIAGHFQEQDRGGVTRRQNRQTGEFEYVVDLPSDIDASQVDATYDNGVLTVTVARTKDTQPRRIEIHRRQGEQTGRQQQIGQQPGQQQRPGQQQSGQQQSGQQQSGQQQSAQQPAGQHQQGLGG